MIELCIEWLVDVKKTLEENRRGCFLSMLRTSTKLFVDAVDVARKVLVGEKLTLNHFLDRDAISIMSTAGIRTAPERAATTTSAKVVKPRTASFDITPLHCEPLKKSTSFDKIYDLQFRPDDEFDLRADDGFDQEREFNEIIRNKSKTETPFASDVRN